ncbi:MAG: AgmX/PglI C-terminal domain-containing protein [Myxococcales bacterium]|nr:AgmX/PglI C-terminal domain-containing protein [Myxococcales bacterium]
MRKPILITCLLVASSFAPACTCIARGPDDYRKDTEALVSEKNPEIKRCYDAALVNDANLGGDVVVNFTVEKKTGTIMNPAVDTERTTAPVELGDCIVQAIDGLVLKPEDQRDGLATFSWTFKANPPPPAPEAEEDLES